MDINTRTILIFSDEVVFPFLSSGPAWSTCTSTRTEGKDSSTSCVSFRFVCCVFMYRSAASVKNTLHDHCLPHVVEFCVFLAHVRAFTPFFLWSPDGPALPVVGRAPQRVVGHDSCVGLPSLMNHEQLSTFVQSTCHGFFFVPVPHVPCTVQASKQNVRPNA